jgi:hypothetical protein
MVIRAPVQDVCGGQAVTDDLLLEVSGNRSCHGVTFRIERSSFSFEHRSWQARAANKVFKIKAIAANTTAC